MFAPGDRVLIDGKRECVFLREVHPEIGAPYAEVRDDYTGGVRTPALDRLRDVVDMSKPLAFHRVTAGRYESNRPVARRVATVEKVRGGWQVTLGAEELPDRFVSKAAAIAELRRIDGSETGGAGMRGSNPTMVIVDEIKEWCEAEG